MYRHVCHRVQVPFIKSCQNFYLLISTPQNENIIQVVLIIIEWLNNICNETVVICHAPWKSLAWIINRMYSRNIWAYKSIAQKSLTVMIQFEITSTPFDLTRGYYIMLGEIRVEKTIFKQLEFNRWTHLKSGISFCMRHTSISGGQWLVTRRLSVSKWISWPKI